MFTRELHEWLKPRVGVALAITIYALFAYEIMGKVGV